MQTEEGRTPQSNGGFNKESMIFASNTDNLTNLMVETDKNSAAASQIKEGIVNVESFVKEN